METILILCQNSNIGEEEQKLLAFESLKPSHHPLIGKKKPTSYLFFLFDIIYFLCIFMLLFYLFVESYAPNLWIKIVNRFQLKPSVFIRLYEKKLIKLLIDDYLPTKVSI